MQLQHNKTAAGDDSPSGVAARAYIFAAAPPSPTTTKGAQNIGWAK